MMQQFNRFLDQVSDFLAHRKGLLPLIGMVLIIFNAILQFVPGQGWLVETDLLLHIGLVVAIFGFLIASAL
ncbi:MAG: hypothetical protein OHK0052_06580 [Anaerolineales bacterium]